MAGLYRGADMHAHTWYNIYTSTYQGYLSIMHDVILAPAQAGNIRPGNTWFTRRVQGRTTTELGVIGLSRIVRINYLTHTCISSQTKNEVRVRAAFLTPQSLVVDEPLEV